MQKCPSVYGAVIASLVMVNKQVLYLFVNKTLHFSVGGSICSKVNTQQMAEESMICSSGDKLMCSANYIGN